MRSESNIDRRPATRQARAAGVSPPWYGKQTPCGQNRTSFGDRPSGNQERRASARRGWGKSHPHTRPLFVGGPPTVRVRIAVAFAFLGATGGLRPPLLALLQRPSAGRTTIFAVHTLSFPRAAGVSPPWERNAPAMSRVFPGRNTFAHHGWLTPAAPGCTCGCHCRRAFFNGKHASVSHGWLTPAAPVVRCNFGGGCPAGQNE